VRFRSGRDTVRLCLAAFLGIATVAPPAAAAEAGDRTADKSAGKADDKSDTKTSEQAPSQTPGQTDTSTDKPGGEDKDKLKQGEKQLLGDLWGLRPALEPYGITFGLTETSEALGNFTGGLRRGAIYDGVTDANVKFDFRPYFKWRAVFFVRAYQIHGRGLTANYVGNLDTVSSIEATRTTRLFELWYEQHIADWLRIRVGQQNAGQEFMISEHARLFINGTFGWPALPSIDLPSGNGGYPLATPAIRFRIDAGDDLTLFAGLFNGDPAGPGVGDPQLRDASGTAFRVNDGAFAITELRYNPGNTPSNGTYRLGGWFHSERFRDPRFDTAGVSLASPASNGQPRLHQTNQSLYAIVDQPIGHESGSDAGFAVFGRAMAAPSNRNLVDFYADAGITYKGPFERKDDIAGIGIAYTRIGNAARALDADRRAFTGLPFQIRDNETVVELTYQAQLAPWFQVQPNFQYIFRPDGGVSQTDPTRHLRDAAVLGVRTVITF